MKGARPLTDEEVRLVLGQFRGRFALRDKCLLRLGITSGFRISELLSIRVGAAIRDGRVVDRLTVERKSMKRKIEGRTVLLHPDAKAAILDWYKAMQREGVVTPDTYLFRSRNGENKPISRNQAWKLLNKVFDRCGLTGCLGTHVLRKTFADRMFDKLDRNIFSLHKALGQKNVNSAASYISFREDEIEKAILSL